MIRTERITICAGAEVCGRNIRDNDINMVNYVYNKIVRFAQGLPLNAEQDTVNGGFLK